MQIIATDDEKGALAILLDAIEQAVEIEGIDAQIKGFRSAKEALEYGEEQLVDVAFLDIRMREMTGIELATRLKENNPRINIIFVTGYSDYMMKAFELHVSGYVTKPVDVEDVCKQLKNLLYPIRVENEIYVKCFGNFEVVCNGKPVEFKRSKAKEMLAYLIDRQGASATRKEIAAAIFGDQDYDSKQQNYFTKIYQSLKETLVVIGLEDVLVKGRNSYYVDMSRISCDVTQYRDGNKESDTVFRGEYMSQYSWAENTIGTFYI